MYSYIDISQYKRHALCLGRVVKRIQIYRAICHCYKSLYYNFFCRNIDFGMSYAIVETHNINDDIYYKGMYEC